MSDRQYRKNHYVPVWYQKRFIPPGQRDVELHYLDLQPGSFRDPRGVVHQRRSLKRLGPRFCFAEQDLYNLQFGADLSTDLERLFFGGVDTQGRQAVEYFSEFEHPSVEPDALQNLLVYMTVQKLRSPKGLSWLKEQLRSTEKHEILRSVVRYQQLFAATWSECIWLIADASQSKTKFIVSDHPVTIYNRRCGPRSQWCRGHNDPDIRLHASHTLFPLSLDKILIFTNLSWARNPYQSEVEMRPNPILFRTAIFNFLEIQTLRHLSEEEVRQMNFIIKSRAMRYVAAGQEDWLYPERHVSKSDWNTFGYGYLLMPDPRGITFRGETFIGHQSGAVSHFDAYGRRPWQQDYGRESNDRREFRTLYRFKGEFAHLFGPTRRGRTFEHARLDPELDDGDFHQYHLSLWKGPHQR
jgi:hypothetical protein